MREELITLTENDVRKILKALDNLLELVSEHDKAENEVQKIIKIIDFQRTCDAENPRRRVQSETLS